MDRVALLLASCLFVACGSSSTNAAPTPNGDAGSSSEVGNTSGVRELGTDATRKLVTVGTAKDGLASPHDLEFHPTRTNELWTVNQTIHGTVIYFDPGTPKQRVEVIVDAYARHFMAKVSAFAFGANDTFATCQESRDEWNEGDVDVPDDFMGPTLWSSNLSIYGKIGQKFPKSPSEPEGSHLDMLHQSPLCTGMAHEKDNVYWTTDGLTGQLVRYDFQKDHGPGGGDHSDGIVRRFSEATITRVPFVPSHMVFDASTQMLYVADTGGGRVMRLDTASGSATKALPKIISEKLVEHSQVTGTKYDLVVDGLKEPAGLALHEGRLFVSEHATGTIYAYSLDGKLLGKMSTGAQAIMGLTIAPDGKLWFVDGKANTLVRVDP